MKSTIIQFKLNGVAARVVIGDNPGPPAVEVLVPDRLGVEAWLAHECSWGTYGCTTVLALRDAIRKLHEAGGAIEVPDQTY